MALKIALGFAFIAGLATGWAQQPVPIEAVLAQVAKYEAGQSRESLFQLTMLVQDALASAALIGQIEARFLQFLQSDATPAGKEAVSIQLSLICTDKSIPVLSAMLTHPDSAEMGRYALARISGPKTDAALRNALEQTSGTVKIGIVNSLGQRRDERAVPELRSLAMSADPGVAAAAIAALGDIGNRPALDALAEARKKVSGPSQMPVLEAYLQCAGRLAHSPDKVRDKSDALAVYKRLLSEPAPPMIHVAALTGIAGADGRNALPALAAQIGSQELEVQDAAIRLTAAIPGRESTAALMDRFVGLPSRAQVRVLTALAERGDTAARPLLNREAKGSAADLRTAALAGLGRLGDQSSIALLAEAAASRQPAEQAAARQSLAALAGPGIDAAIVAAMGTSSGSVKAELILAAGERGDTAAANASAPGGRSIGSGRAAECASRIEKRGRRGPGPGAAGDRQEPAGAGSGRDPGACRGAQEIAA